MNVLEHPMNYFWWLSKALFLWVKSKVIPENIKAELDLEGKDAVLYVLPHRSFYDLLVLHYHCEKAGLPLPRFRASKLMAGGTASYLYLRKLGWLQPIRSKQQEPPTPLKKIVKQVSESKDFNVKLVPVSIIWGRNPNKQQRSLLKLLFADDEHAGLLQKSFIVLAQGKDVLVHFGKPISVREQLSEGGDLEQISRKIRRVMRVHFRQQRNIVLGPKSYDRNQIIPTILQSRDVSAAIDHEVRIKKIPREKAEELARSYIYEISSEPSHAITMLFDRLLHWMFDKMYSGFVVRNVEKIREFADKYEFIFMSTHRSHLDYMIIGYVLYQYGMAVPHTAAGINLNFWPVGTLLRKGGAFFLKRTFGGNRLYTVVFQEYLYYLISRGYSINFFPEGGRSRTGKLLQPKTGMLAMIVQSYLRKPTKPIAVVPVYIGYDRVLEVKSYSKELRGAKKTKESFGVLLKTRNILKVHCGKAYLSFGSPIVVDQELGRDRAEIQKEFIDIEEKPKWFAPFIHSLSQKVMTEINRAAILSPVGLFSLALLSSPQKAMAEDELLRFVDVSLELLKRVPYADPSLTASEPAADLIKDLEQYSPIKRFKSPGGDVIYLDEMSAILVTYYRNNILHLFALPSLVASFFQYNDSVGREALKVYCEEFYPFLQSELFLYWQTNEVSSVVDKIIDAMIKLHLITYEQSSRILRRADVDKAEFAMIRILGRALGVIFERYSLATMMLAKFVKAGPIKRQDFESRCQHLIQRVSILNGISDPVFQADDSSYNQFIELLKQKGYVSIDQEELLHVSDNIQNLSQCATALLSPDIRHSIKRSVLS